VSRSLRPIVPLLRVRWHRLQLHDSLARDRWWLSVQLGIILALGFGGVALFTYANALAAARRQTVESTLPLTLDALSADLQQDFVQPILFASAMGANTLLVDWVQQGERPEAAVQRYLSRVQAQHGATTAFFVSDVSRRYYHPTGVLKTVSPGSPQDAWFFRLRSSAYPYEVNLDRDTADLNRTTVFVNYKLLDGRGRFLGAVGLGRSTSQLTRRIQLAERTNGIQVMFLDRTGKILFSNQPSERQSQQHLERAIGLRRLRDSIRQQPRGAFHYRQGNELIYVHTKRIPELNWILIVSQPLRVPSGPLWTSLLQISLIALLTLMLALLLVFQLTGRHHHKLARLAHTDPLSGALNRSSFAARFRQLQLEAGATDRPLALILLDVDHFKAINDGFGHLTGDTMIRRVAEVIRQNQGPDDVLFRWGGEEFVLLLPDRTAEQACRLARTLSPALRAAPLLVAGVTLAPTLSAGVTHVAAEETADTVLARADAALYAAKRAGRNRVMAG
jgi:diguanylate cyclase (GGDEF)-like protein